LATAGRHSRRGQDGRTGTDPAAAEAWASVGAGVRPSESGVPPATLAPASVEWRDQTEEG